MGKKKSIHDLSRDLQVFKDDEMKKIKGGKRNRRKWRWFDLSGRLGGKLPH